MWEDVEKNMPEEEDLILITLLKTIIILNINITLNNIFNCQSATLL